MARLSPTSPPSASGGEATVSDANLATGTSPDAAALTRAGDFTINAADGVNTLTIGGVDVITSGVLNASVPIVTGLGILQVTGYDAATGKVSYAYTLTVNAMHDKATHDTIVFDDTTVTLTDTGGDSVSSTLSIRVLDDTPTVTVTALTTADALVVDETDLTANATASFADNFGSAQAYGADGSGSVTSAYTLAVNAGTTGLTDTATGQAVVLSVSAGVVEGRTATNGFLVFTLSVASNGDVTLDQLRAVVHNDSTDPDEAGASAATLAAANLITLTRTDTITDGDGDTSTGSATINLGSAISFEDDGPSFTQPGSATPTVGDVVISALNPAATATTDMALVDWRYGADGAQSSPTLSNTSSTVAIPGRSPSTPVPRTPWSST